MKKPKKKRFLIVVYAIAALAVLGLFVYVYFSRSLPSIDQISNWQVSQSTKIYDRTGTTLLYEISGGQERTVVPLEQIPQSLKDATIAIEDEKFYAEPAFSWTGILRSLFVNVLHGQVLQGGSTITQQLAKNAFLTGERTITRKLKEILLAIRLDSYYSKDQILALYLNQIPYGATSYGVEAASEAFFDKPVQNLNLAESAVLAALPNAPTYYSPWGNHVKELMSRQKLILQKMVSLGKISQKDMDAALQYKIAFAPQGHGILAPHFVMAVQDYLVQKYGEDMVQKGGLRVTTTLDWGLQQIAEKVVADGAAQNETLYGGKNAALVAQDPKTGQVLALVGSRDYFDIKNEGNFDVATQGLRQPGSSLKPFIYFTAFQKGYTPNTVIFDTPTEFAANNPLCPAVPDFTNGNKMCFHPQDFEGYFSGPMSLRTALAQSVNVPAVKMLYLAGLKDSVKNAYNFGLTTLTSPDLYGLSLVLGGGAVHLIDLTEAYSVLAEDGVKHVQSMVLEVKDASGHALESWQDHATQVADPQSVRLVNNILSDSDARSGLFQNSLNLTVFPGYDVALKTGTSNDYHDAWTNGYTPSLVVSVWAGNNDNTPLQRHGSSILAAVPIWHAFMAAALPSSTPDTFNRPDPISAEKPIFAGDYLHDKQVHSILYYVDKSNPLGPAPANPADDPQFTNWETGVLNWEKASLPDFANYNQLVPPADSNTNFATGTLISAGTPPEININSPNPGSSVSGLMNTSAFIRGISIAKIRVYWNGAMLQEFTLNPTANNYDFRWSFSPQNIQPQNLLEIEAITQSGASGRSSVVVYGQ